MAKRKVSKKSLKAKAWKTFSEFIRKKYADENGFCKCVTCGKIEFWKKMQAGHAVGGRNNAVLFHEEIVHVQCVHCNIFMRGNYSVYTLFMIDTYGRERFEELLALKNLVKKLSNDDLRNVTEQYQQLIEMLNQNF